MVYDDRQRIHEGFWEFGNREGHGRCVFLKIGDVHEGEYVQNLRHGPGKYLWKDGRAFMGNYQHDERQGTGVFSYPNGDSYQGNFSEGQRSGYGTFTFRNGAWQYKGEWKEGVYEGKKGRLEWKVNHHHHNDGGDDDEQIIMTHVYIGDFAGGVFHGQGKESVEGRVEREGIWNQGKFIVNKTTTPETISDPETPELSVVVLENGIKQEEPKIGIAPGQVPKELDAIRLEDTPQSESPKDDDDDDEDDDDDDILAPPTELEKQSSAPIECPTNLEHNYDDERQEWRNSLDLASTF